MFEHVLLEEPLLLELSATHLAFEVRSLQMYLGVGFQMTVCFEGFPAGLAHELLWVVLPHVVD